jgi:hypothetical protein
MSRYLKSAFVLVVVILLGWLGSQLLMSPEEQLRNAQTKFLKALEERSWLTIATTLSDTYLDDWGQNSGTALTSMKLVLGGFTELHLEPEFLATKHVGSTPSSPALGMVDLKLKVSGQAKGGVSQQALAEAQRLQETDSPWVFHWRKEGSWPWSWKLAQVNQEDARTP